MDIMIARFPEKTQPYFKYNLNKTIDGMAKKMGGGL
jgi:hypothetical protein